MGRAVRLLLDTHALLWWLNEDRRLTPSANAMIGDPGNEILVSVATGWEVATKSRLGKLQELRTTVAEFATLISAQQFGVLPISLAHAIRAGSYEADHGDPFDRIIAAQSELESLPLVTRDPAFAAFPCETRW